MKGPRPPLLHTHTYIHAPHPPIIIIIIIIFFFFFFFPPLPCMLVCIRACNERCGRPPTKSHAPIHRGLSISLLKSFLFRYPFPFSLFTRGLPSISFYSPFSPEACQVSLSILAIQRPFFYLPFYGFQFSQLSISRKLVTVLQLSIFKFSSRASSSTPPCTIHPH